MKALKIFFYIIMILLFVWLVVSWVDVIADNCTPDPVHYSWNMFVLMEGWMK